MRGDRLVTLDNLTGKFGNGTLRITTRQGFQLHGVLKDDLKAAVQGINETLLTRLAFLASAPLAAFAAGLISGSEASSSAEEAASAAAAFKNSCA